MATTHDFKNGIFFHVVKVIRGTPIHHRAKSQEIEEPFRYSESHVIRLWPTRTALVIGRWTDSGYEEVEALRAAMWAGGDINVVDAEGHIRPLFERD